MEQNGSLLAGTVSSGAAQFEVRGSVEVGRFTLGATEWIKRPNGAVSFGLSGQISGNGLLLSGRLLGCNGTEFQASRPRTRQAIAAATSETQTIPAPSPPGPLEGVWRGAMLCQKIRTPLEIVVSHRGDAVAAYVVAQVTTNTRLPPTPARAVFLPRTGSRLDGKVQIDNTVSQVSITALVPDPAARTILVEPAYANCTAEIAKTSQPVPSVIGSTAFRLAGSWVLPPAPIPALPLPADNEMMELSVTRGVETSLSFRAEGRDIVGQLRAAAPPTSPPAQQDRLVATLRPLLVAPDGRVGFVTTERLRAEGVFTRGPSGLPYSGATLLLLSASDNGDQLLGTVESILRDLAPNLFLRKATVAQAAAVAQGGRPMRLPPGLGGTLGQAASLTEQCEALAEWAKPLISRPDARTASVDRLQREALPILEDAAFVPVFGRPYAATTGDQRRAVAFVIQQSCAQSLKMTALNHYSLTNPMAADAEIFGRFTSALMERHDGQRQVREAAVRMAALPPTAAGLAELATLERGLRQTVELLDEAARRDMAALTAQTRARIETGILQGRVAAIDELPGTEAGLGSLRQLSADLSRSSIDDASRTAALAAINTRGWAIAEPILDRARAQGTGAAASLAGLADTGRAAQTVGTLSAYTGVGVQSSALTSASAAIQARRRVIVADAGVQSAFAAALADVAHRGDAGAVRSAATVMLPTAEMQDADPEYARALNVAVANAERQRLDRVLGQPTGGAPPPPSATAGEPTERDMLGAVDALLGGLTAGQANLSDRCARREFANDPALAMMCLTQMGSGGPMRASVSTFRKIACAPAQAPGYVCDFTFSMNISTAQRIGGVLGDLAQGQQSCSGRFVATASGWALLDRECR